MVTASNAPREQFDAIGYQAIPNGNFIDVWDSEDKLFSVPISFTDEQVISAVNVYTRGRNQGEAIGRLRAQADMRKAMGVLL